ncbi:thioredoxin domain-containing protein [Streptomyces sp. ISL-100]|uniref:thioredoxin domain-containing protein n=1 Tax=Streptomyces sp. ISL-100 TaxID=2819173 RepID=UPI001BECB7B7|nr:thioredoxin domain-containing protein [Streptomyces sp. ISL-100]MBT2399873.1 thioredoxin domain-containing protein [Streptomyces sp. ISL-100]
MSDKNRDGKRTARERLIEEREAQKARDRRRRTLIVAAAVVGVLGLAAVAGILAANMGSDGDGDDSANAVVTPKGTDSKGDPMIPVGAKDAPSTLTVWEDFRCPACAQFENAFRETIHELERAGQIKVEYHLATLIDGNMGGSGSLKAANAAACAQDVGKFAPYHDVLYQNQPPETDDAFSKDSRLIELAGKVDGLVTESFKQCVADGTHNGWVRKSNEAFQKGDFRGTPTVQLNGESIFPQKGNEQISPDNLKKWVAEANKGKKAGTATATPPASASATSPAPAPPASSAPQASVPPGAAPQASVPPASSVPQVSVPPASEPQASVPPVTP